MLTVAVYNIKGGVGKTTTAVNLAFLAATEGRRTLVWDLDPQGAASFYFRVKAQIKGGHKQIFKGGDHLLERVRETDYPGLDLLPADFALRHLDLELEQKNKPTSRIRKVLRALRTEYDLVILDCPPSISLLSEAVFEAADLLLVPTIPTTLSLRTLAQLARFRKEQGLKHLRILPFFSMVDRRKNMHRQILELHSREKTRFLRTTIPYASEVEQMGLHQQPLPVFASRRSPSVEAYHQLWLELKTSLDS